jgi:endonuclease/exonuclease/phosphatase family metal-dependent hydrolase
MRCALQCFQYRAFRFFLLNALDAYKTRCYRYPFVIYNHSRAEPGFFSRSFPSPTNGDKPVLTPKCSMNIFERSTNFAILSVFFRHPTRLYRRALARPPQALLALFFLAPFFLALSRSAPAAELKIATWNLDWLTARPAGDPALPPDVVPKRPEDIALLAGYAARLSADVVALEEVDGPAIAARLFPPDRYALHFTGDRVVQRVGFAIRRDLAFNANPDLVALDPYPDAPHPLRSGADVTLRFGAGLLRLLAIHLKSGCRDEPLTASHRTACETLRQQLPALEGWIAQRRAEGVPFVILGDFNRWLDPPDQMWTALNTAAPLVDAAAGRDNPCWGGAPFIDHILAGAAARTWMEPDTLCVGPSNILA